MCVGTFSGVFYIILHRKFMTVSNMKISDLIVGEPQIKTQVIYIYIYFFFLFFFSLTQTISQTCADGSNSCVCNCLPWFTLS